MEDAGMQGGYKNAAAQDYVQQRKCLTQVDPFVLADYP